MSSPSTLYSKLKILVAKLYKAEKLYSSMKRLPVAEASHRLAANAPRQLFPQQLERNNLNFNRTENASHNLIEQANEVRSGEWHKVHQSFRIKLNDLLLNGNSACLSENFNSLWLEFLAEFEIAELDLQDCNQSTKEALIKEEYSYLFKLSYELIKRKARLQALKVIHDELNSLLNSSTAKTKADYSSLNDILAHSNMSSANVIPIRRKAAN